MPRGTAGPRVTPAVSLGGPREGVAKAWRRRGEGVAKASRRRRRRLEAGRNKKHNNNNFDAEAEGLLRAVQACVGLLRGNFRRSWTASPYLNLRDTELKLAGTDIP